jgi:ornithine cyclodeaminase/alanine dehydrogenase-like protein (mu-crystallin family)
VEPGQSTLYKSVGVAVHDGAAAATLVDVDGRAMK